MNRAFQNERIKRIAQNVLSLPALPTIIAKLIELIDNPRTSASNLTRLISADQVLTAKILKLANSAFYGFPRRIATVNLAIVVLGFDTIKDLGLSFSIVNRFRRPSTDPRFDMSRFWEHSIACGVIGKMIARQVNYRLAGEAFVAGLLHDIGKLILNQYFPKDFSAIMDRVEQKGESYRKAEMEVLGLGHALVGKWLIERWNLPNQLVEVIEHHHTPHRAPEHKQFAAIIQFADYLCKHCDIGFSGDHILPVLTAETLPLIQPRLNDEHIDLAYYEEAVSLEMEKAETFVNVIQGRKVVARPSLN